MTNIKIGIIREGKVPHDKRVALTPLQCSILLKEYPGLEILVQPCSFRCYEDHEYADFGIKVRENLTECDVLIGIKEVPIQMLVPGKKYLFFSHTIKKQPHNREMLKAILAKKIELIDYECLTDMEHNRIIGFGRYAGVVGAYNGILGYGKKYDLFHIKAAHNCRDREEMEEELKRVKLSNIKILVTGGGRVANGAIETLGALKIRKVTPYEFLNHSYREPVYCQLHSKDYHLSKQGNTWESNEFYAHPEKYVSNFLPYTKVCDLLITCHYWNSQAPVLFTKEDMKSRDFRISVVADVSCDLNGSVPSTLRASSIAEPFYGYNPITEKEDIPFSIQSITVMAIDNLPCELPRDSSEDFGKELIERVIPNLLEKDKNKVIERATITQNGHLMPAYEYLKDYVD